MINGFTERDPLADYYSRAEEALKKDSDWTVERYVDLRGGNDRAYRGDEVIEGLLRVGEVMILVSNSKAGKSWMAHQIAWSIATGRNFLGMRTRQGRVLIIDTELKQGDFDFRLSEVARALHVSGRELEQVDVIRRRGLPGSIHELAMSLADRDMSGYGLIVIDSLYKLLPPGASENDNAEMGAVMNAIQGIADRSNVPVLIVHHSPKGDTSGRSAIDVTSGAGAFGRSMDSQITIRPHADENYCVCDFTARTNPPKPTITVSFDWPLWQAVSSVTPELATQESKRKGKQIGMDDEGKRIILGAIDRGRTVLQSEVLRATGMGSDRLNRLVEALLKDGKIKRRKKGRNVQLRLI